jgi:hypothetical protein
MAIGVSRTLTEWVLWDGEPDAPKSLKLAVMGTSQFSGETRTKVVNGVKHETPIYEPLPKETWTLHFTNPVQVIDQLKEMLDKAESLGPVPSGAEEDKPK